MHWIRTTLEAFGDKIACHEADRVWTYAEFLELIDVALAKLPHTAPDVIEVTDESTIKGLAKLLAIVERGHIALPLPPQIPAAERERMRSVASASPLYDELEGSGLVLFSSGTSGEPKGMLHNFDALLNRYRNLKPRQDRSLLLLLIDHIGGLDSAFRCLFAGSTLVIPESRTPEAAGAAIAQYQVNVLPASPTFLNLMLLAHIPETHDLSSVGIVAYGAEAMPQSVLHRLAEAFPNARLQQKFGTSETGAIRIRSADNKSLFFRIDDPDTEWKVIDNELWLKTPSRILGYLNAAQDNLESDGWYRTGDLVETDGEGNLHIIGRASALINVGGQKVHPAEIEALLNEIPEILSCRVYGISDPITGSKIACEILPSKNTDLHHCKRIIRQHCRGKIDTWKIPSKVELTKTLQTNSRLKGI